ncbi:dynein axonemal assembly factor 3 isoform X2 [Hemicordylus capensis]|nr:dynein axonemal assembly factor 3 isoform X2 [Hemicordylus capensis]XP_053117416.1 dynein axonemal assembly factor 3 isoform X2 [Hemicordylus capensis]XP_053117417.1 dynein axonemal assembly factor 3 isoform X2 [Hemicordylus capensis]XP_053117419.1 dynein axonemal assembly factor 3 isoform X2 [Hemicordylus capensis]XP_053117420.1 dynein axonemal assembly factor 3 isoform X2 [Hemicordylus capensis]XP_053117421.1 dynein axonemal assembly factor 3 isoform X2 [Hemicordylus capensis]XP_05311742
MTAVGSGNGFGTTAWWGFSPALDLQDTYLESSLEHLRLSQDGIPELNILLVGSVDGRHIFKTMSQAHQWPRRKINFYVLENNLEALGRQLLFLNLALEPSEKMGLQEKSEMFLELMGNTLLRSQTAAYLQEKSDIFIRYVTDPDFQQTHLPILDLSALKFKERDQLEAIFQFWRNPDPHAFQIKHLWDLRLRQYLGTRYDSRRGVCDWDLNMTLHEHGAKVINFREFFQWRDTGVAFEMREAPYDIPNKTLASGRLLRYKGEPVPARGYWGDIATGPYITFGIESEDTNLLKTRNGLPTKSAQEISLHNVTALMYGLTYHAHYDPPAPSNEEGNDDNLPKESDHTKLEATSGPPCTEDVRVHFLPLNCLSELHHKSKYQQLFNIIFFSCSMVHFLKPNVHLMSAPKSTLIVELTNFLPDLHKEQVSEFASRVISLTMEAGFVPVETTDKKAFSLFQLGDQEVGEVLGKISPLEVTEPSS